MNRARAQWQAAKISTIARNRTVRLPMDRS
jgi:hypothetical protein